MPVDFSNIELSLYEKAVLRSVFLNPCCRFVFKRTVDHLVITGMLWQNGQARFSRRTKYKISDNGKMYFRVKRKERFRFMVPIIISIVALLAGYDVYKIPLLGEALSALKMLLIDAVESLGILP